MRMLVMVCTSEYYLQHKQPAHYLVRKRGKQEWRKLLPISARKRLRGSWEIVWDILGSNPSCIKTEKKIKINLNFGKKSYYVDPSENLPCTTLGFGQIKLYNNLFPMFLVETEQTLSRARIASASLSSMDLDNFTINVNYFLHSLPSGIFNKHNTKLLLEGKLK